MADDNINEVPNLDEEMEGDVDNILEALLGLEDPDLGVDMEGDGGNLEQPELDPEEEEVVGNLDMAALHAVLLGQGDMGAILQAPNLEELLAEYVRQMPPRKQRPTPQRVNMGAHLDPLPEYVTRDQDFMTKMDAAKGRLTRSALKKLKEAESAQEATSPKEIMPEDGTKKEGGDAQDPK